MPVGLPKVVILTNYICYMNHQKTSRYRPQLQGILPIRNWTACTHSKKREKSPHFRLPSCSVYRSTGNMQRLIHFNLVTPKENLSKTGYFTFFSTHFFWSLINLPLKLCRFQLIKQSLGKGLPQFSLFSLMLFLQLCLGAGWHTCVCKPCSCMYSHIHTQYNTCKL